MGSSTSILTDINPQERYSYSRLSLFDSYPCAYKYKYIDNIEETTNAFSSYGSLVHSILERYANGEIELWELSNVFDWEFDINIVDQFPYDKNNKIRESYRKQGLNFFNNFQGYEDMKILGVEQEILLPVNDWYLYGFIDLLYQNKDGDIIIRDYKSKASFKNKQEQAEYAKQLYLYALWVYQTYGKYPSNIEFVMFRTNKTITLPFDIEECQKVKDWANNVVQRIRDGFDYPAVLDTYYCSNICGMRHICEFRED